jgi:hypothetical protein
MLDVLCSADPEGAARPRSHCGSMEIGSLVTYQGRAYYLRGLDPMSVTERQADLEDVFTHERVSVLLDDVVDPKLAEDEQV